MTKEQIGLLKSFCAVNTAFVLDNKKIGVLSADTSCCLFYEPKDFVDFDIPSSIYQVDEFLNVLETIGIDSIIERSDSYITLKNNNKKIKYGLAESTVIPTSKFSVIEDKFSGFDISISFDLEKSELDQIKKISSLLNLDKVIFKVDGKSINVVLRGDSTSSSSDSFSITTKGKGNKDTTISISTEELKKLIPDSYTIESSDEGLTKFTSKNVESLRYYIANIAE